MDLFLMNGMNSVEEKGVYQNVFNGQYDWNYAVEWQNWRQFYNEDSNIFFNVVPAIQTVVDKFTGTFKQETFVYWSGYIQGDGANHSFTLSGVNQACIVYVNGKQTLSCDYASPQGGRAFNVTLKGNAVLKAGSNHVEVAFFYGNQGGGDGGFIFKIDDQTTDTFVWYLNSGGVAAQMKLDAAATAAQIAADKAEQDRINKQLADEKKAADELELEKIRLAQLQAGGGTYRPPTGTEPPKQNNLTTYLIVGGVALVALFGFGFMMKGGKKR